jgi:lysophospholipase L1-like esterase
MLTAVRSWRVLAAGLAIFLALSAAPVQAAPVRAGQIHPPSHSGDHAPGYYLALGDSLAVGQQPGPDGQRTFTEGYVGRIHDELLESVPKLRLVNLGCSGETTDTMIAGGVCTYKANRSQLAAATKFLHAHRKFVRLVTIDIGANDVLRCAPQGQLDAACLSERLQRVAVNLTPILSTLREAAPGVRIIGMNYYDPFLAAWLRGPEGQQVALASLAGIAVFNDLLEATYAMHRADVADVETAFSTFSFTPVPLAGFGPVPLNVSRICQWTWMCAPPPRGPDIHPNDDGYAVIAAAFVAELRPENDESLGLASAGSLR